MFLKLGVNLSRALATAAPCFKLMDELSRKINFLERGIEEEDDSFLSSVAHVDGWMDGNERMELGYEIRGGSQF